MPTVTVPLTRGKVALIDGDDLPLVAQYRWSAHCTEGGKWYAIANVRPKVGTHTTLKMHRLILDAPKGLDVDHRDGDGLNNTRGNIRLATRTQNRANTLKRRDNRTGYKGVYPQYKDRYGAVIQCRSVSYYLGYFTTAEDAARAYDAKARELFGEFARCNFPENVK